ncbi:MAG: lipopolysaccharide transport periplasmic protein LptA [Rheinheimera sp.]|nr:MAG: lipopolysaccharide transport periplasmic protein LptA [Rheinheimera sp.]
MKINKLSALLLLCLSTSVLAKTTDFSEPIEVNADRNEASLKQQMLVYSGNVIVKQGTLLIKADKLTVDRSAGEGKEVFIAVGKPAVYSQVLDGEKPIQASAEEIRYAMATRVLTLTGKAEITQSGSLVRSAKIEYDLLKQQLSAESEEGKERVTTIFTSEGK